MKCLFCNNDFISGNSLKLYCTSLCYKRAKDKRSKDKSKLNKLVKNCRFCKSSFETRKKNTKYCSANCASKHTGPTRKKFLDIPSCLNDASRKLDKTLGYVRVYVPMHPEANTWGYVYEHRVIAEQIVSRRLEKNEIVHHKNGKRWDNRIENLEVMNKCDHAKLHGQREEDKDI